MQEAKLALKITLAMALVGLTTAWWFGGHAIPTWLQPGHYQYGGEFKR